MVYFTAPKILYDWFKDKSSKKHDISLPILKLSNFNQTYSTFDSSIRMLK